MQEDTNMTLIVPGLYLGNAFAQRNEVNLQSHGITHILSLTPDNYPPGTCLKRMVVPVDDYPDVDLMSHFLDTNAFISDSIKHGGVLVHCLQGISRSATIVMAYLMAVQSMPHQEAIKYVKARRPIVNPNPGFLRQLEIYDLSQCDMSSENGKRLFRTWEEEMEAAYAAAMAEST